MLTTFEDMYETHQKCAQLLAVKGVLLLSNVHFNLPGGNVIQQHTNQLEEEPSGMRKQYLLCISYNKKKACKTHKGKSTNSRD